MKRLFSLHILLIFAGLVVLAAISHAQQQQANAAQSAGVPHSESLVWLMWVLVLGLLAIIGFMLRSWLVSLEEWKREVLKLGNMNRERIIAIEAKCDIRHKEGVDHGHH